MINPSNIMHWKTLSIPQRLQIPSVCVICQHSFLGKTAVCGLCRNLLIRIESSCTLCRLPLPDNMLCGQCLVKKPAYDALLTAFYFEEPLRTIVHAFKYHRQLYLRPFLAELMLEALKDIIPYQPDCLIPVPLHTSRLKQRGFNQAAELARYLSKRLHIPWEKTLCKKTIPTEAQVNLAGKERTRNLQQAFSVQPHSYQHLVLIDDLVTTGSTANTLAVLLKQQGAKRVDVWCIARTSNLRNSH